MFGSKNVEISTNYWEAPSERMFKEKFTKLKIQVTINPGDRFTQDEMIRNREQFLELHSGHEAQQPVKTHNRTVLTYFVGDNKVVSQYLLVLSTGYLRYLVCPCLTGGLCLLL